MDAIAKYIGDNELLLEALTQTIVPVRKHLGWSKEYFSKYIKDNYPEWYAHKGDTKYCWGIILRSYLKVPYVCTRCKHVVRADGSVYKASKLQIVDKDITEDRQEEFDDVYELLMSAGDNEVAAKAITYGTLGSNHLYSDMGFENREGVSFLMSEYFPSLYLENIARGNMKWKKFLYKKLCDAEEIQICRSPTCEACDNYKECFQ